MIQFKNFKNITKHKQTLDNTKYCDGFNFISWKPVLQRRISQQKQIKYIKINCTLSIFIKPRMPLTSAKT